MNTPPAAPARRPPDYWRRVRRLTAQLLIAWFAITFCTVFFARELSRVTLFGFPLSFYMAAQGVILIYLALVGFYAWRLRRLDQMREPLAPEPGDGHGE